MSVQKVRVMVPPQPSVPRGAIWAADAVSWLLGGGAGARTGLPAWWAAIRARVAIHRAARGDARSRANLLALACHYQSSQPEFAKDLFAAANNDRGR